MKTLNRWWLIFATVLLGAVLTPQLALAGFNFEYQEFGRYTLSVDGGGNQTVDNYNITINKPAGATVRKAYALVANVPGRPDPGTGALTFTIGASVITPSLDNVDSSSSNASIMTARWDDVTADLSAALNAAAAGPVTVNIKENAPSPRDWDGATLFVVWDDPNANRTLIAFKLGSELTGENIDLVINTAPINTTNPLFQAELGVGISFSTATGAQVSNVDFEGTRLTTVAGGFEDGALANGALFTIGGEGDTRDRTDNDERYDVTDLITNNETSLNIVVSSANRDDYLFAVWFSGQAVEPPSVMEITSPADNAALNMEPSITGSANANGVVTVNWRDSQGNIVQTTTVPSNNAGDWTATPRGLPDGQYTVEASITTAAGTATDSVTFTLDTTAPVIAIVAPADNSGTNDNTPTISGTGEAGVDVIIEVTDSNGQVVETLTATPDAQGNWSVDAAQLPDGDYTLNAQSTDAVGNTGTAGPSVFTIDTTAPTVAINTPADGAVTNNNTPVISGMAEAGSTVEIIIRDGNGQVVQTLPAANNNGSWTVQAANLPDGNYTIEAVARDIAGNTATDGPRGLTIDTTAPAVTIAQPADGSATNDNTPDTNGTSEVGALLSVEIRDANNQVVQSFVPTVDGNGNWSVNVAQLADGNYTVVATATDSANNATTVSNGFSVDTTPPSLTLTSPADGTLTNNPAVSIGGTGDAGETVEVVVTDGNGQSQNLTTVVDAQGNWSVNPMMLADGTYTVNATSTDAAGNTASVGPSTFTVDATAPAVAISAPADGSLSNDNTPTVTGTVEPGAMLVVVVRDAQNMIVQTLSPMVDAQGNWTADAAQLPDGAYTIEATASDAAGNTSTATSGVTIDTTAPALVLVTPADGTALNDDTPAISGTNDANVDVTVEVTDANGQVVFTGSTTTDAMGNWTLDTTQLPEGAYTVNASSTDDAGNSANQSAGFTIDTTAPTVDITAPADNDVLGSRDVAVSGTSEPNVSITVELKDDQGAILDTQTATADANGDWTVNFQGVANGTYNADATAADAANNTATDTVTFSVDSDEPNLTVDTPMADAVLNMNQPTVSGTTDADATVTITFTDSQGNVVETVTATPDANGAFSAQPSAALPDGDYTISTTATRPNGKSATVDRNVSIDTTAPDTTITAPVDGSTTNDGAVTVTGTSEPGAQVQVTVTDDQGTTVFDGTVTTDDMGNWSVDAGMLGDGTYTVNANASDAAGNTAQAPSTTFTVNTSAPTVTITSPAANETVEDLTPTITGTADPGATIEVFVDGNKVGEATADDMGNWTFDVPDALTEGEHTIEAKTTNNAGSEGTSGTITITVAEPGAEVVITEPTEGGDVTGPTVTVKGTGEPGDEVTVTINGETQTATVDENGDWTVTFDNVPSGDTTVTAKSGDKEATVNVKVVDPPAAAQFTVTGGPGGCSAAPGQAPSLPVLLLVVLGFIGLRRRR